MDTQTQTAAHTPGPWTLSDHDWHTVVGPRSRFYTDDEGGKHLSAVAIVDRSDSTDEDLANARLIASAPELLAALEAFMRAPTAGSDGPGSTTIVVQDFNLRAARAAITKARGA